jgi:hypothetical protein
LLSRAAAAKKTIDVMRMTPYEFLRACNMARNRVVLSTLGLSKAGAGSRVDGVEDLENEDFGNSQGVATAAKGGRTGESCGESINPRRSSRLGLKLSSPEINRSGWPAWLGEKFDHYASLQFGGTWKDAIIIWTEIERAMGFRSPVCRVYVLLLAIDADFK